MKPREFWISLGECTENIAWEYHPGNEHYNYHVIEYQAYEDLKAHAEKLAEALADQSYIYSWGTEHPACEVLAEYRKAFPKKENI